MLPEKAQAEKDKVRKRAGFGLDCAPRDAVYLHKTEGKGESILRAFSALHPSVLLTYFLSVLLLTMFAENPVLRVCALLGGALCAALSSAPRGGKRNSIRTTLPFLLLVAVFNPLFVHEGVTVLFWLGDTPFTLEALLYGVCLSLTLAAVILWCGAYNRAVSSDKLLFLFGKAAPRLTMTLCMALRFLPELLRQLRAADRAQTALGMQTAADRKGRIRGKLRVLSSVLSISLENAMETAASMQARGHALPGRTHFALYRFTLRDGVLLAAVLLLTAAVLAGFISGEAAYSFYPRITAPPVTPAAVCTYIAFLALTILPALLEAVERGKWKFCVSKI